MQRFGEFLGRVLAQLCPGRLSAAMAGESHADGSSCYTERGEESA